MIQTADQRQIVDYNCKNAQIQAPDKKSWIILVPQTTSTGKQSWKTTAEHYIIAYPIIMLPVVLALALTCIYLDHKGGLVPLYT